MRQPADHYWHDTVAGPGCAAHPRTNLWTLYGRPIDWGPFLRKLYQEAWYARDDNEGGDMATPEGRVKTRLNKRLAALNFVWKFMPVQMGYGLPALDYLLCVAGHFVAIETKAPGKSPTPRQEATIAAIRAAGGLVFIVEDDMSMDACIGALVLLIGGQRAIA